MSRRELRVQPPAMSPGLCRPSPSGENQDARANPASHAEEGRRHNDLIQRMVIGSREGRTIRVRHIRRTRG